MNESSNNPILGFFVSLVILGLLGGVGYFITNLLPTQVKNSNTSAIVKNFTEPSFAAYKLESTKYTPAVPEYKLSLSDISNLSNFQKSSGVFSDSAKKSLVADNFFITKNSDKFYNENADGEYANRNDDWTYLYDKIDGSYYPWERQPENSVFISTDFLAHTYHKLIDNEISYIEETSFYPTLNSLSQSLLKSSSSAYAKTTDQQQKDSYERLSAYFLVTSAILDSASVDYNKFKQQNYINDTQADSKQAILAKASSFASSNNVSDNAKTIANQEINLILDANQAVSSPLMGKYQPGMKEDYTQFGPRSHYTKNAILRDYFRAMMFYGRMNFLLKSTELTRDAANINLLLTTEQQKQWESIYQPTAFFVGKADDLGVYEYNQAIKTTKFSSGNENDSEISKLQNELITYKNPQIMSSLIVDESVTSTTKDDLQKSTKGFRFMGQRFTPDAFIFSTLTQGDELPDKETGQSLPSTPTALMVSTLMGSNVSSGLLNTWIKDNAPDSDKVIAKNMTLLKDYFSKITQQQWTQNIYWSWLYTIKSLFTDSINKTGFPMFVKSENWNKKTLQTFLGSWTELKHDTLLYAKQSYAEKGAGGPDEQPANPIAKGYVEPNVDFLDRLITLVNLTDDGLDQYGLLSSNIKSRNDKFKETLQFYRTIAVAELENKTISDDDFEKLRLSAGPLDNILGALDSQIQLEKNARSAIIADVHTDGKLRKILYEADGIPNYIYVAVKDTNGTRLTKGLVYSYYEFSSPIGKRLTDQDWQDWSYSNKTKLPSMQSWNKDLIK